MKTAELTGAALDWAVAKCEGATDFGFDGITHAFKLNGRFQVLATGWDITGCYHPSTDWTQGGPIIEREGLQITTERDGTWVAGIPYAVEIGGYRKYCFNSGSTPLIAAMRCYVASKLGDEVEIPKELV